MTPAYDIGDKPRLSVAFADYAEQAADPTTITFKCTKPDGTIDTYVYGADAELEKDSTGNYHVDYSITQQGRHSFKFIGAGVIESTEKAEFYARAN